MTSGVESFVHCRSSTSFQVLSSTRFQVEPPGGAPGFLWCCFLRGGMELACGSGHGLLPLFGTHFRIFSLSCLILALLGAILAHLGALGRHLVAKLLEDGAQMAQHRPT